MTTSKGQSTPSDRSDDSTAINLAAVRLRWLEVLDVLEQSHRTAWLALFDARLSRVAYADGVTTLWLDFADRDKFAGAHTFDVATRPDFLQALSDAIQSVVGVKVAVTVELSSSQTD